MNVKYMYLYYVAFRQTEIRQKYFSFASVLFSNREVEMLYFNIPCRRMSKSTDFLH